jgi:hypothetical protein
LPGAKPTSWPYGTAPTAGSLRLVYGRASPKFPVSG